MSKKKRRGNNCIEGIVNKADTLFQEIQCLAFVDLERQLRKSVKLKDDQKICDFCVELGDEYRRIGDLHEALNYYRKGAKLAEKLEIFENAVFIHRAIAEILVNPSIQKNAEALQHGKKYLEAANGSGKIHFIQLAYHVLGWLHLQIYLNSNAKEEGLLEKAKQWCEKSLIYLSKHALDIDCDKE
uniref:Tetratricopeptide repeat protein n=1 Tax=Setaria digitata TaxID=48799 RepID=A0A915Q5P4_9BILA